jgi:hypothetical protein
MEYVIVSTSKCLYQKWQLEYLERSFKNVNQTGQLIILLSEDINHKDENIEFNFSKSTKVIELPDWAKEWELKNKDWWGGIPNKYESISWLCKNSDFKDTDKILFLDPDMIFLQSVDFNLSNDEVIGQKWKDFNRPDDIYPRGSKGIMYPFALNFYTLKKIIKTYKQTCIDYRINTKRWEAEMFGLDYAFKFNSIDIKFLDKLGICTVWEHNESRVLPNIIHYPNIVEDEEGNNIFFKQQHTTDLEQKIDISKARNTLDTFLLSNIDQKNTDYRYYNRINDNNTFKFYTGEEGYVLYKQWPGGFNNIRMSFELAICLAVLLNRTLVLPPNSSYYLLENYCGLDDFFDFSNKKIKIIKYEEFRDTEHILDTFDNIKSKCKEINTKTDNCVYNFEPLVPPTSFTKNRQVLNIADLINENDRYLYFDSNLLGNFYSTFYTKHEHSLKKLINKTVRYRNEIFDIGWAFINLLGDQNYYSVHLRRNDFQYKDLFTSAQELLENLSKEIPKGSNLYIATDHLDTEFFDLIKEHYNVTFYSDLKSKLKHLEYNNNWIPIIEQLICTRAIKFIGNKLSTLSSYIYRMRGLMSDIKDKNFIVNTEPFEENDQTYFRTDKGFVANWSREYKDAWDYNESSIFVSIASYCDTQIIDTLKSLYEKVSDVNRVTVCVNLQDTQEQLNKLLEIEYNKLIILYTPKEQAKGVVVSRNKIKKEITDERYFLQVDSHTRFKENWDLILINQLNSLEDPKAIITTYPNHFDIPDIGEKYLELAYNAPLRIRKFLTEDSKTDNRCIAENYESWRDSKPFNTKWAAAGFLFTKTTWTKEVILPDNIRFNGEEDFQTFISFLKGWNLKVCSEATIWHNYNFKTSSDIPYREHNNKYLIEDSSSELLNKELFKEGYERSLEELEEYFEIKLRR